MAHAAVGALKDTPQPIDVIMLDYRLPDSNDLELLTRIFVPFCTTKSRGSGRGLPTAKRLIEVHHGNIQIACPPGGGTIVTVQLPSERAEDRALSLMLPDSRRRCRNSVHTEPRSPLRRSHARHASDGVAGLYSPGCERDRGRFVLDDGLQGRGPTRCLVTAAEASERESTSFETQHRFMTAQAARQLVQAVHCPSHGDLLPIASSVRR